MCGITAIRFASPDADRTSELEVQLRASIKAMDHRGPDESGTYVSEDGLVGLGHARLSIIDLSGGHQPLHDEEDIHAVVNGEIYDYAAMRKELEERGCLFKSNVDSELVVHLYKVHGQNLVHYLRGEFAFVLYDAKRKLLLGARDCFGIKPFYYTVVNGSLMIASEMKALLPLGWKAEWDVESIVQMGDYNDDRTIFKDVYKLPAAHVLTFSRAGQLRIRSYWDHSYPDSKIPETRSVEEMIEKVRERLVDSVRARLRSDVPLGVYLSGGIDSACVAGIAASLLKEQDPNAKFATFTLAFPGREDLDEGPAAKRMADFIGADIHQVTLSEADIVNYYEKSVYHTEYPVFTLHGSGKIILAEFVRQQGYRVVLTGEGSDETFGGYSFLILDYLRAVDAASRELGFPLPEAFELAATLKVVEASSARSMLGGISTHRAWATTGIGSELFTSKVLDKFGYPDHSLTIAEGLKPEARGKMISGQWHPLHSALYTITNTMLSNGILNYVGERAEMAGSIEGRPPFLDHILVDFVNTLPPPVKMRPSLVSGNADTSQPRRWTFTEKWILRQPVKPFVTEEIYKVKKSQYNVPISRPQATDKSLTPLQVLLKTRLTQEAVEGLGWANWTCVSELLKEYIESPECQADGGLDKRARIFVCLAL
ncbi:asparagine synthase [Moniliophthora roreri MCA 2997]|uniref:Asparagine synthase n=1 Tax=Moniliophthora roreri (strain MCA 2997) TaxID=1381753 RepID=V2WUU1_MONRO|nr:asparagine synthase [Moniliophthora roreri MCA 2997]